MRRVQSKALTDLTARTLECIGIGMHTEFLIVLAFLRWEVCVVFFFLVLVLFVCVRWQLDVWMLRIGVRNDESVVLYLVDRNRK